MFDLPNITAFTVFPMLQGYLFERGRYPRKRCEVKWRHDYFYFGIHLWFASFHVAMIPFTMAFIFVSCIFNVVGTDDQETVKEKKAE